MASINNDLKPFKVFGMVAQTGLTMSVLTAVASFYSVIFTVYSASSDDSLLTAILNVVRR